MEEGTESLGGVEEGENKEITVSGKDSTRLHSAHFEAPKLGIGVMEDNRICEENLQNLLEEFKREDNLGIFDEDLPVPCLHEIREQMCLLSALLN
ncbi:hypothetical protein AKJ16_DCAP20223 [Drosera capensis]